MSKKGELSSELDILYFYEIKSGLSNKDSAASQRSQYYSKKQILLLFYNNMIYLTAQKECLMPGVFGVNVPLQHLYYSLV